MNDLDSPIPINALEIGLSLLALGLLFGAWLSRRAQIVPLGYWPLAWAVLIGMGALRVAGGSPPFEYFGTVIYCALMLAGAFLYADRPVPSGFLPATVGTATLLLLLGSTRAAAISDYATLVFAPLSILAAAAIVRRAAQERGASLLHRVVPYGLLILAALGVYDDLATERSVDSITIWLVAGTPIATNQAVAVFDRFRQRADEISRELEESVSLLQATLESTADGILVVDTQGR